MRDPPQWMYEWQATNTKQVIQCWSEAAEARIVSIRPAIASWEADMERERERERERESRMLICALTLVKLTTRTARENPSFLATFF